MNTVIFTRNICLPPCSLGGNISEKLLNKAIKDYIGHCTKDLGYILSIDSIEEITDNCVTSANSDAVFTVKFKATVLKPEKQKIFTAKVCMVNADGLFVDVYNTMKVLVPRAFLKDFTFEKSKTDFHYKKGKQSISVGSIIQVKITNLQYSGNKFSCFGDIVEEL